MNTDKINEAIRILKEEVEIKDTERLDAILTAVKALETVRAINDLIDEYDISNTNSRVMSMFEIKLVEALNSGGEI